MTSRHRSRRSSHYDRVRRSHRGIVVIVVGVALLLATTASALVGGHRGAPAPTPPGALVTLTEPAAGYGFLVAQLGSAHYGVDVEMYELDDPAVIAALIADHRRGVTVKVLLDKAYDGGDVNAPTYRTLSTAGVTVRWSDLAVITHEKMVCVDLACDVMTGNLTPAYYTTSRDFVVVDRQPGDVEAIEAVFSADWGGAPPSPAAPGTDLVWSPGSATALIDLIGGAQHSILLESEEMSDATVTAALVAAAHRGVEVSVAMTANPTYDTAFDELRAAGVKVKLYTPTASLYIHAKAIVVDGERAFVGSENLSPTSLDDNRELGLITTSRAVVNPVAAALRADVGNT